MAKDPEFLDERFDASPFGPTREKGVYAICVFPSVFNTGGVPGCRVVYIGSSLNINKRVSSPNHIYRRLFNLLKGYHVACMYFECEDHVQEEIGLIKKYKPRFNLQYNG